MAIELTIYKPTDFIKEIQWNKDEIKALVIQEVEKYNNLVFTDNNIADAKKARAELNASIKAINSKRTAITNELKKPADILKKEVDEIISIITTAVDGIDGQIKDFETREKIEKQEEINKLYSCNIGELKAIVPLPDIQEKEWLNKTLSINKIEERLISIIDKIKTELEVIESLNSPYVQNIKDVYLKNRDLKEAFAEDARLKEQAEKLKAFEEAKKAKQEQERKIKEQLAGIEFIQADGSIAKNAPEEEQPETIVDIETGEIIEVEELRLVVFVDKEQKAKLRKFLFDNKIKTTLDNT